MKTKAVIMLGVVILLIVVIMAFDDKPKSKYYTAEELANMSAEELAKLVPEDVLKRFTPEELANMTPDELKHIVPTKFQKKERGHQRIIPQEPIKVPSGENNSHRL